MDIRLINVQTEIDLRRAISCYITKTHFDMCAELLKLGMISETEFVRRAQHDIDFNPGT